MGDFADAVENELLDHVLGNGTYTRPTNLYVALCETMPVDTDTGGTIDEVSGGGYTRMPLDLWSAATGRMISNSSSIIFPAVTNNTIGVINSFAILDAATLSTGNMIAYGEISPDRQFLNGKTYGFDIGDVDVSFNVGGVSDYLANELLDHVFKNDVFTPPANYYQALAVGAIVDADTGSTITEPSGSYERKEYTGGFATAIGGLSDNSTNFNFVTSTTAWGTILAFPLCDAVTAGNLLFTGAFNTAFVIEEGKIPNIAKGILNYSMN